ncbi:hypothetical protein C7974DRAFT_95322 [Boeremia exigua]|uniref:uncharacterized protein n=1 Tax=Boeremia exigua TaxID=749465 RepID=UPI001E8EE45A|nr:uncharacterized protein C7974DRAFT_95322 [Boeremia exigua]KAH6642106.1 hypothetical protein C7974DRAFT_95322 [Boeremia exigua]
MAVARDAISFAEFFPLRDPTENIIGQLYQCLWGWQDCVECANRGECATIDCRWMLRPSLSSFSEFYQHATYRYTSEDWFCSLPLLRDHGDLQQLIRFIVERPELTREVLMSEYFGRSSYAQTTESDRNRAVNLAYSIISMLPCAERNHFYVRYPILTPVIWKKSQAACEVWGAALPIGKTLTNEEAQVVSRSLSAKRLQECGFEIVNTNDPRLHLVEDSTTTVRRVYIFHQAGFLKEHLSYQVRHGLATK